MPSAKLTARLAPLAAADLDVAKTFESPTAEVLAQSHPMTERGTLYVLVLMLLIIGVFMAYTKIDRVVSTTGRLVPTSGTITVQPLETQIISRVLVQVGDVVKKGQILATCDPTLSEADRVRLEKQVASLDSQVRRLTAEAEGREFVPHADRADDALQAQIFLKRQAEFRSGVSDLDQRVNKADAEAAGYRRNIAEYQNRRKIGAEMEGMQTRLAKEGFISHMQLLGVQDQQLELQRLLTEAQNDLASTSHELQSLREQRKVFVDHWHSETLTNLAATKSTLDAARQDLAKASRIRELVNLVSPEDAIVTRIPGLSVGGVATGAQALFNLVPLDAPLEAAVQIASSDIGFLKVGDPVNLKFDAFKFLEHGTAKGVVKSVSQDSFSENPLAGLNTSTSPAGTPGAPMYFDARVRITELQLRDLPRDARLLPGMTLTADVVVGQRTIMWYLLGGALRSGAEAMREP